MSRIGKIEHDEFVRLWNEGLTVREIAEHFGCCKQAVSRYAKMREDECPKRKRGRKRSASVNSVVELRNKGLSIRKISKELHISRRFITKYLEEDKTKG